MKTAWAVVGLLVSFSSCVPESSDVTPRSPGAPSVPVPKPPSTAADRGPPTADYWELTRSDDVRTAALGRVLLHRYRP
jgi:hypothetical protein